MIIKDSFKNIEHSAKLLKQDKLVAIPTETVYGLAGNAYSEKAIQSIYEVKNRPAKNPLIVHIKNKNVISEIAKNIPEEAFKLADAFWPGPLTLVLEKQNHILPSLTANKSTVGVRMPNHEITLELLKKLDFPLVAPSANRSNHISPTTAEHVRSSLASKSPYILEGGVCKSGIESTIIGFKNGKPTLYRHGAIAKEEIEDVLNCSVVEISNDILPESPGMFKKHYSPNTPLLISKNVKKDLLRLNDKKIGIICFQNNLEDFNQNNLKVLSSKGNLKEAASKLYSTLHGFDNMGFDLILAEEMPNVGLGLAINDRLKRASFSEI